MLSHQSHEDTSSLSQHRDTTDSRLTTCSCLTVSTRVTWRACFSVRVCAAESRPPGSHWAQHRYNHWADTSFDTIKKEFYLTITSSSQHQRGKYFLVRIRKIIFKQYCSLEGCRRHWTLMKINKVLSITSSIQCHSVGCVSIIHFFPSRCVVMWWNIFTQWSVEIFSVQSVLFMPAISFCNCKVRVWTPDLCSQISWN